MIKQLLIFLLCVGTLFCQTSTPQQIKADYDFAQFRGSESQTLLEIYYAISRETIAHISSADGFSGSYKITLNISQDGSLLSSLDWQGGDQVKSLEEITTGQIINDVKTLLFKPGEYTFQLVITDLNNSTESNYYKEIVVQDFSIDKKNISDIQFSHLIQKAESANRFVKNGFQITPNSTVVYSTNQPILYYYLELYNLGKLENNFEYSLSAYITNQTMELIKTLPTKQFIDANESQVVVNSVYVGALFTGIYSLNIELINPALGDTVRQNKQFYVYRPTDQIALAKSGAVRESKINPYALMSEEELDREFEYLRYTLDSDAMDRYEELNLVGKQEYINIYWTEKESVSPNFKKEFYDRIDFANNRYSIGSKEGWKTQMGRVVIMYGIPDGIDKQKSVASLKDYEIWNYENVEGGSIFVFVNTSGYGELRLVHSTVMDEIKDYDWQTRYLR